MDFLRFGLSINSDTQPRMFINSDWKVEKLAVQFGVQGLALPFLDNTGRKRSSMAPEQKKDIYMV